MRRKIISILLALLFLFRIGNIVSFAEQDSLDGEYGQLKEAYQTLIEYGKQNGVPLDITQETFELEYYQSGYDNVDEYIKVYYGLIEPQTGIYARSSKGSKWYYDTGTSLPQKANYSKFNLLNVVQPGDIIHEAKGGFGITAHTAIVEGVFYDSKYGQYYVRVIEAIDTGVKRSVLDDERVGDKGVSVYRVHAANVTQKYAALQFCIGQLNKAYSLDFGKHTSPDEKSWYCSELVWAGYYNQGIDIETSNFINEPGVTPRDIINSKNVSIIPFK